MKIKADWLLYRIFEGCFFVFLGFLRCLPSKLFCRFAFPFLWLVIRVAVPRKRIVKNLGDAFGHSYSMATKIGLARGVQDHFARNLMDCFLQLGDSEHARRSISIQGRENLDVALAKGKGILALGAHIGNFVLVGTRLGIEGYSFNTLFRLPPDRRIRRIILRYVPGFFQTVIPSLPKLIAVREILHCLKKKQIVFILGDNLKKGAIEALLFGQRVPSPRGPISLALRSEAPVVPMYLVRNYQGGLLLVIEPELPILRDGNLPKDIEENTRRVIAHLENLIRRYPDQWNWLTVRMNRYQGVSRKDADGEADLVHESSCRN